MWEPHAAPPPEPQSPSELLAEIEAARADLLRAVAGVAPGRWNWRPVAGQPSLVELLAPLAPVDRWALAVVQAFRTGAQPPPLPPADEPPGTRLLSWPDVLEEVQAARADLLRALRDLRPEEWDLRGFEPTLGETSIAGLVRFLAQHDRNRAEQARAILSEVGTGFGGPGYRPPDRQPDPQPVEDE